MHAYDKTGKAVYEVPNISKGGMRATTIADVRKLKLGPGVTEATGQLDKPALLQWHISNVLKCCYETDLKKFSTIKQLKSYVSEKVKKEIEKPRDKGTKIHDELEQWFKQNGAAPPHLERAIKTVTKEVGDYKYIPEQPFYHPFGFGGKVDLHAKEGIVLDFKTKDTLDVTKMKGYKEHIMQLAAYRHGLGMPKARCYNLFISSQDTNIIALVEYTEKELYDAWEMFKCLLKFWQISNKMEVLI